MQNRWEDRKMKTMIKNKTLLYNQQEMRPKVKQKLQEFIKMLIVSQEGAITKQIFLRLMSNLEKPDNWNKSTSIVQLKTKTLTKLFLIKPLSQKI